MDILTYSDARASLKSVMDSVVDDHVPVVIARQRGRSVVMVSLEDWEAMETTMHLLSSPANAERLNESIKEFNAGGGTERALIYP